MRLKMARDTSKDVMVLCLDSGAPAQTPEGDGLFFMPNSNAYRGAKLIKSVHGVRYVPYSQYEELEKRLALLEAKDA
jgi:hypothetical protein